MQRCTGRTSEQNAVFGLTVCNFSQKTVVPVFCLFCIGAGLKNGEWILWVQKELKRDCNRGACMCLRCSLGVELYGWISDLALSIPKYTAAACRTRKKEGGKDAVEEVTGGRWGRDGGFSEDQEVFVRRMLLKAKETRAKSGLVTLPIRDYSNPCLSFETRRCLNLHLFFFFF